MNIECCPWGKGMGSSTGGGGGAERCLPPVSMPIFMNGVEAVVEAVCW